MRIPGMMFEPHLESEERKRSAIALIKYVLAATQPEIRLEHRRELLSILLWKLTEAPSRNKYATRYQSKGAWDCSDETKLQHDRVYQRSKMIRALERAMPDVPIVMLLCNQANVSDILEKAVGCTVTKEEHRHLSKWKEYDGWERYRKAGITVIDTQTGKDMEWDLRGAGRIRTGE